MNTQAAKTRDEIENTKAELREVTSEGLNRIGHAAKEVGAAAWEEVEDFSQKTAQNVDRAIKKKPIPILAGVAVGSFLAGIFLSRKRR